MAAPTNITENTEIQAPPEGEGSEPTGRPTVASVRAQADLQREYVTVGGWGFLHSFVRALSNYIDDVTRDFGIDQYERMMTDSQVSSVVKLLVMATLADGVQISAAVDQDDERWEQAERIAQFCERNFERLGRPLHQVLYEMVEGAFANGHKVAEQVYEMGTLDADWGPQLLLRDLKPKPNTSVAFVVDLYMNVIGLLYVRPGQAVGLLGGRELEPTSPAEGDEESTKELEVPALIPREKFAVLTHLSKDGDPRGMSGLRCIYTPWWVKQQTWRELLAFLARFGSPSVVGNTSPTSEDEVVLDPATGEAIERKTPEQVMSAQLELIRNGAVGAFPPESEVKVLEASGEGRPFFSTLDLADKQIAKGVLLQTLATEEGQHQARAAAQTHQDVLGLLIHFMKGMVLSMISGDILTPLVRYNYGEAGLNLLPSVSLGEVEQQDFATYAKGIASLASAGVLHESQYPGIWDMLHLPPADEEAMQADQEARRERAANLPPAAPAGDDDEEEVEEA
jgi:hypothetical protein